MLNDEHRVLPVTSRLEGVHGLSGVCLSMPSVVGRAGVERVLATPLSSGEREQLVASAEAVRAASPWPRALTGSRAQVPGRSCSTRSFSSRTRGQAPSDQFDMTVQVVAEPGSCRLVNDTPASYPSSHTASPVRCRCRPSP